MYKYALVIFVVVVVIVVTVVVCFLSRCVSDLEIIALFLQVSLKNLSSQIAITISVYYYAQ